MERHHQDFLLVVHNTFLKSLALVAVCLLCSTKLVWSQYYNNSQYIIGEEAAGLAGAYTAIADNSTALWYNPAGLAHIHDQNINISGSAYSYLSSVTPNYIKYVHADSSITPIDFSASDFSIISTTLLYGKKLTENSGWAFGLCIPFQDNLREVTQGNLDTPTEERELQAQRTRATKYYQGLIGFGWKALSWYSVGLALKMGYHSRQTTDETRFSYVTSVGNTASSLIRNEENSWNTTLGFQFGGQVFVTPHIIFAGNFSLPHYNLIGQRIERKIQIPILTYPDTSNKTDTSSTDFFEPFFGWEWNFGLGYLGSKSRIDFDWIIIPPAIDKPHWIINYKFGYEYSLKKPLILRTGVSTDLTQKNSPLITDGDRVNYYTWATSLSFAKTFTILNNKDNTTTKTLWTTFGTSYKAGVGETITSYFGDKNIIDKKYHDPKIQEFKVHNFQIFLAENMSF